MDHVGKPYFLARYQRRGYAMQNCKNEPKHDELGPIRADEIWTGRPRGSTTLSGSTTPSNRLVPAPALLQ